MYPAPQGKSYSSVDLLNPSVVMEVFDYCQILLATILPKGWQFLFSNYTIEELFEIDKKSGWFQLCSIEEFKELLEYESLIAGYNPNTGEFGEYNEETGLLTSKS